MRNLFNLAGIALLAMAALAACGDDGDGDKSLKLTGGTQKEQTVYADQTQKTGGINFTATAIGQPRSAPLRPRRPQAMRTG